MSVEQLRRARTEFRALNKEYNRIAHARDGAIVAVEILDRRVSELIAELRDAMDECQRIRREMK